MTLIPKNVREKHIVNCEFIYVCPQTWDALTRTVDKRVRHCSTCQRDVHFCATDAAAEERARAGHCVAVLRWVLRTPAQVTVGMRRPGGSDGT